MNNSYVDARGLSCPEPVLLTKSALMEVGTATLDVRVSSPTARDNVNAFLLDRGRSTSISEEEDGWLIHSQSK